VGVDIGGTKVLGVLLGPDGTIEAEMRLPTPIEGPDVVAAIVRVVDELAATRPGAVGVGIPGLVDAGGTLRSECP
jgi:glucokinase